MATLSTNDQAALASAIDLLLIGTAYETPVSEDVIQRIAPVAVSLGLSTVGGFYEAIKLNPVSTLLKLVALAGA